MKHFSLILFLLLLAGCAKEQLVFEPKTTSQPDDVPHRSTLPNTPPLSLSQHSNTAIPHSILLQQLARDEEAEIEALITRIYGGKWEHIADRSRYVLGRIKPILSDMNAPMELLAVPVIESAYSPYAFSHAGALGLWQIMPGTARHLGIKNRQHSDGRRHVEESTAAAIQYLLDLHARFNSWPLAIASYHLGPNAVDRRLRKKPWHISQGIQSMPVPKVTRNYVRMVLGLASLLHKGDFQFPEPIATTVVTLKAPIDLLALEHKLGLPTHDLFRLNPGLNYSQYLKGEVSLYIPKHMEPQLHGIMADIKPKYVRISIKAGDSLWKLAKQHSTSVDYIKKLNPGKHHVLHIGDTLVLPVAHHTQIAKANSNPLASSSQRIHYKVRSGDSLWKIAKRFGTSTMAIAKANSMRQNSMIRPGDRLWIVKRPNG